MLILFWNFGLWNAVHIVHPCRLSHIQEIDLSWKGNLSIGQTARRCWHDLENANPELRRVISALHCDRETLWEFLLNLALIIIKIINMILIIISSRRRKLSIATKKDFRNFGSTQVWCGCKHLRRKCLTPHAHIKLDIYKRLKARRWDLEQTTHFEFTTQQTPLSETHWEENVSHLTYISSLIFTSVSKQEDGISNKQHISNTP